MDTSPEYIKMCEKATEIQEIYEEWPNGSVWFDGTDIVLQTGKLTDHPCEGDIWLPRQDQLQEIVKTRFGIEHDLESFLNVLEGWNPTGILDKYHKQFSTFEQLWLAFVMWVKFNKTWNGEEWI